MTSLGYPLSCLLSCPVRSAYLQHEPYQRVSGRHGPAKDQPEEGNNEQTQVAFVAAGGR